jgi:nascent polypeptide-associated complex subunit alpha
MFGNIDPKKMNALMKQFGVNQEEIDASKVIIEKNDGNKLIIENPSVVKIKMQGQESFQIVGNVEEVSDQEKFSDEDIKTIIEKTGCSEEEARDALSETGDLAEAIFKLSN